MKMFDFAEITNDMSEIEILNYYRNLYYTEPQVTERGIVANAINDMFDLINRQKAEIEKLKAENRILSRNGDTAFQDGLNERRELFEPKIKAEAYKEFEEKAKENFLNLQYNAKTDRKTVKIEELKEQMDWLLHTVAIETVENLLKEMVGEEE